MIIEKIISQLPPYFYFTVFALSILYLLLVLTDFLVTRLTIRKFVGKAAAMEKSILLYRGCNIENLPLISDIFEHSTPRLNAAYNDLLAASNDFYHKKWIPNPSDFFNLSTVFDINTHKKLKGYRYLNYLFFGVLLFVCLVIWALVALSTDFSLSSALFISLIPVALALFFAPFTFLEKMQNTSKAEAALQVLNRTLRLKLPVFSENSGLSLLIDQFLEYDRDMSKTVEKLTEKIDRFVMDGLTTAVSESVEKTLLDSVAPSIKRATDAIIALSQDIAQRESNGMQELAVNFSSALSSELTYHLEPLIQSIHETAATITDSKKYLDIATSNLDVYRQKIEQLHNITSDSLKSYEKSKQEFGEDVHLIADSMNKFGEISSNYNNEISLNIKRFELAASTLNQSMETENNTLRLLLDGIFIEAQKAEEQTYKTQKNVDTYINSMQSQIDLFSSSFSQRNKELLDSLSVSMSSFLNAQSSEIAKTQDNTASRVETLLESMEESAKAIKSSTDQIKSGFDELEEARIREEEKKKGLSFFRRKKI
jgi:hypothetical protein